MTRKLKIQPDLVHVSNAVNLSRFGSNLISVFIPLIIIQRSSSLHDALQIIAGFYFITALVKMIVNVPAMLLINRVGAPFVLGFGFVINAVSLGCFLGYTIHVHDLAFLAAGAIFLGASGALSDDARHVYIAGSVEHEGISSSMATMSIIGQGADVTGPLLGALIGSLFGVNWLIIVALCLMSSSVIPLMRMSKVDRSKHAERPRFSLRGAPARDIFANVCFTSDEALGIQLWPVYLAVILGSLSAISLVVSIAAGVTMVTIWLAGHLGDKGHDRSVMEHGIAGASIANAFRLLATTPFLAGAASSLYGGSREFALNGLNSISYANARIRGIQYVASMQIACDIGYSSMWGIMLAIISITNGSNLFFKVAFAMATAIIWGILLISRQQRSHADKEAWGR